MALPVAQGQPTMPFNEPTTAPPGGTDTAPITTGASQVKQNINAGSGIGAFEMFVSAFENKELQIIYFQALGSLGASGYQYSPSSHRQNLFVRSSDSIVDLFNRYRYVKAVPSRGAFLGPLFNSLQKPRSYHVELSRLAGPPGLKYCAAINNSDPCSVWFDQFSDDLNGVLFPFGKPAPLSRMIRLNDELIDDFCGDQDGCTVAVGS